MNATDRPQADQVASDIFSFGALFSEQLPAAGQASAGNAPRTENGGAGRVPQLPAASAEVDPAALAALRAFCSGSGEPAPPAADLLPALLWPFRDAQQVRTDFPLLLYPAADSAGRIWAPLGEALAQAVERFAPGPDQARVLRDNLLRLERTARRNLGAGKDREGGAPVPAHQAIAEAGQQLLGELKLPEDAAEGLRKDLEALVAAIPEGELLGLSESADLYLLRHAAQSQLASRRVAFYEEVALLVHKLRGLLVVEQQKAPGARSAAALAGDMGDGSGQFVDFDNLSGLLGEHRGTVTMPAQRRQRIEKALQVLEAQGTADRPRFMVVHQLPVPADLAAGEANDACAKAMALFDAQADVFKEIYRAMRIARLEVQGAYVPEQHDAFLAKFDHSAFSREELACLPVIVAVAAAEQLAGAHLGSLVRLLGSGRPVQVVARVNPAQNPAQNSALNSSGPAGERSASAFRLELGALGLGQREAFVHQGALAQTRALQAGYCGALDTARAALHVLAAPPATEGAALGPWMQAQAALEGRAHPLFCYAPEAGDTWARRMDISANPAVDQDWPVYELVVQSASGGEQTLSLPFTFVDYALLDPASRDRFCVVPESCAASDELVPVDVYLGLEAAQAARAVPFIWGVDASGRCQRLAVAHELIVAQRDRHRFWRSVQELGGVRNEHVERAVAAAREEIEARAAAERAELEAAQQQELERVRTETAGEAMDQLAAALTGMDVGALSFGGAAPAAAAAPAPSAAPAATEAAATEAAAPAEAAPAEEESLAFDDPFIDSALCTSCNDCINLNQLLFSYNENKQAVIGDVSKGTFEQLVVAAEKCPARCIHPGKPQNPDEPNLDALIKRAAPFN